MDAFGTRGLSGSFRAASAANASRLCCCTTEAMAASLVSSIFLARKSSEILDALFLMSTSARPRRPWNTNARPFCVDTSM